MLAALWHREATTQGHTLSGTACGPIHSPHLKHRASDPHTLQEARLVPSPFPLVRGSCSSLSCPPSNDGGPWALHRRLPSVICCANATGLSCGWGHGGHPTAQVFFPYCCPQGHTGSHHTMPRLRANSVCDSFSSSRTESPPAMRSKPSGLNFSRLWEFGANIRLSRGPVCHPWFWTQAVLQGLSPTGRLRPARPSLLLPAGALRMDGAAGHTTPTGASLPMQRSPLPRRPWCTPALTFSHNSHPQTPERIFWKVTC